MYGIQYADSKLQTEGGNICHGNISRQMSEVSYLYVPYHNMRITPKMLQSPIPVTNLHMCWRVNHEDNRQNRRHFTRTATAWRHVLEHGAHLLGTDAEFLKLNKPYLGS